MEACAVCARLWRRWWAVQQRFRCRFRLSTLSQHFGGSTKQYTWSFFLSFLNYKKTMGWRQSANCFAHGNEHLRTIHLFAVLLTPLIILVGGAVILFIQGTLHRTTETRRRRARQQNSTYPTRLKCIWPIRRATSGCARSSHSQCAAGLGLSVAVMCILYYVLHMLEVHTLFTKHRDAYTLICMLVCIQLSATFAAQTYLTDERSSSSNSPSFHSPRNLHDLQWGAHT